MSFPTLKRFVLDTTYQPPPPLELPMAGDGANDGAARISALLDKNMGKVIDLFHRFDKDGSGEVSKKELKAAMVWLGLKCGQEEVDALFNQVRRATPKSSMDGSWIRRACDSPAAPPRRIGTV